MSEQESYKYRRRSEKARKVMAAKYPDVLYRTPAAWGNPPTIGTLRVMEQIALLMRAFLPLSTRVLVDDAHMLILHHIRANGWAIYRDYDSDEAVPVWACGHNVFERQGEL